MSAEAESPPGSAGSALEQVRAVAAAAAAADGVDPLDEATWLALASGLPAGAEVSDAGFAFLLDGQVHLAVAPSARGGGVGSALARGVLAGVDGAVSAWSHADHPAAAALASSYGFERVRDLWVLRRGRGELPSAPPPEGVSVRAFAPGDEEALLEVNAAAFAAHPEQGGLTRKGLAARMAEAWFSPAGLLLAWRGAELLGFHWTKVHPDGEGEVYVVGVSPSAQGLGLGRALTVAGLRHLYDERGVESVRLFVESDNAVGRRLYEGLGFTHGRTHAMYRRT